MSWLAWVWIIAGLWFFGAIITWQIQKQFPVTEDLAFWRSILWPIYLITGWPWGTPMNMD